MSLVIEMAGLPGAGKTTAMNALREHLTAAGLPTLGAHQLGHGSGDRTHGSVARRVHHATTAFAHRRALLTAARVMKRNGRTRKHKFAALRFLTVTFDRYRRARSDSNGPVVLFDEGVAQRCFMVFVESTGAKPAELDRFLSACPAPDFVVLVEVEPTEALARMDGRSRGLPDRMAHLDEASALEVLAQGRQLLGEACDVLSETSGTTVFRMSSADPARIAATAGQLKDELRDVQPGN